MTPLANALACLIALGCALFLWRKGSSPYRNGALLAGFLLLFGVFTYFGGEMFDARSINLSLVAWTRILAIFWMGFCSTFLSKISKEMEFCLMVFWLAVWVFF